MPIRRALLLLAIVLGLAALAASLTRPREAGRPETVTAPPATTGVEAPQASAAPAPNRPVVLELDAARPRRVARLDVGRAAVLLVAVPRAGEVTLPELGQAAAAEPLTPARFELLESRPGRYELRFTAAGSDTSSPAGVLELRGTR